MSSVNCVLKTTMIRILLIIGLLYSLWGANRQRFKHQIETRSAHTYMDRVQSEDVIHFDIVENFNNLIDFLAEVEGTSSQTEEN